MTHPLPTPPITLAEIAAQFNELLTTDKDQRVMRSIDAFWRAAVAADRVPRADVWLQIAELIDGFGGYEPNPQFCDRSKGYYDYFELKDRVNRVLASAAKAQAT